MNIAVAHSPGKTAFGRTAIRVMIVDDSVVVRGLLARWIEAEPDLEVVASPPNGLVAVEQLARVNPDVVILDIEMPELDGISALPILLAMKHDLVVMLCDCPDKFPAFQLPLFKYPLVHLPRSGQDVT